MSLKARLRIAIIALVTLVVLGLSLLDLSDLTRAQFANAASKSQFIARIVRDYVVERVNQQPALNRGETPAEAEERWTATIRTDPRLQAMLLRSTGSDPMVLTINIADQHGAILAASNPAFTGSTLHQFPSLTERSQHSPVELLWSVTRKRENFETRLPVGFGDKTVFTISVVMQSLFLRTSILPALEHLGYILLIALLAAVSLAAALPYIVLRPLERFSRQIDLIRKGESGGKDTGPGEHWETREFADVQSKLNLLGQQFSGAKRDAAELRTNIDQLLDRMQEAVLLADPSGRLILAGGSAESLLGRSRAQLTGRALTEIFPPHTPLGALLTTVIAQRRPVRNRVVPSGQGTNFVVDAEIVQGGPGRPDSGGLVLTIRDAETRKELELQLNVSSRLAAISRLTGGVAHEIKNPLNAIALHLEILRSKLDSSEPELDVIANEIRRLDQVVRTFLKFSKPIELNLQPVDCGAILNEVATLVAPEAKKKHVTVRTHLPPGPLLIKADSNLMQQAILNVVINSIEAVPEHGTVDLRAERSEGECLLTLTDNGPGIPKDVQHKIFDLYFSTKQNGSGIGLAVTFQMVQLHSGTIDVVSEPGKGTSFRLRFPETHELAQHTLA